MEERGVKSSQGQCILTNCDQGCNGEILDRLLPWCSTKELSPPLIRRTSRKDIASVPGRGNSMCKGPVVPARKCREAGVASGGSDGESNTGPAPTGKAEPALAPPHPLSLAHSYSSFRAQLRNYPSRKPLCPMQVE